MLGVGFDRVDAVEPHDGEGGGGRLNRVLWCQICQIVSLVRVSYSTVLDGHITKAVIIRRRYESSYEQLL